MSHGCHVKSYCPSNKCDSWRRDYCNDCGEDPCCCSRRRHRRRCGDCRKDPCCCPRDYCCNDCGEDPCCCSSRRRRRHRRKDRCCDDCCDDCYDDPCCDRCDYYDGSCGKECCLPNCVSMYAKPICGAYVVPVPISGSMSGYGEFILDNRNHRLHYKITLCHLSSAPVSAGFYNAGVGAVGPLVKTLNAPQICYNKYVYRGKWQSTDAEPLTDELMIALYQQLIYFQVNTVTNPAGEVRGQILPCYQEAKWDDCYKDRCRCKRRGCRGDCC